MLTILGKLEPSRSQSGFKYIANDSRSRNAYQVIYRKFRSPPMFTLFEAAMCLLQHTRLETPSTAAPAATRGSRRGNASHSTRSRAPGGASRPKRGSSSSKPCAKGVGSTSAASWMSKPKVKFSKADCDYFGARIRMARQDQPDGAPSSKSGTLVHVQALESSSTTNPIASSTKICIANPSG